MRDQLDATISDFIVNQLFLSMFRAPLHPSSGGQTAFHCLWSSNLLHTVHTACHPTLQHHNSYNRTENLRQWNAVWPPDDGRKDARNMLRNNLLPIKSLIVASSWFRLYLLICLLFCETVEWQPLVFCHAGRYGLSQTLPLIISETRAYRTDRATYLLESFLTLIKWKPIVFKKSIDLMEQFLSLNVYKWPSHWIDSPNFIKSDWDHVSYPKSNKSLSCDLSYLYPHFANKSVSEPNNSTSLRTMLTHSLPAI